MIDTKALFSSAWKDELEKRMRESPSYGTDEYTVTGRAAAKYGGKRSLDWWADNGPSLVDNWVEWRKRTRWDIWEPEPRHHAIELEINFDLPGDIRVKTFIDRVFVLPSGIPAIVDLKTGRTPETTEQLGLYACAIQAQFGVRIDYGYWWDANKGEHVGPFDLTMWSPQLLAAMYRNAIAGINAGSFLPRPANGCANWCGVADFCAVVGGPKAPGNDPLLSA